MKTACQLFTLLASSTALILGCAATDAGNPMSGDHLKVGLDPLAGGTRDPPAGSNGDSPRCLWNHNTQADLRYLASIKLDAGGGALPYLTSIPSTCRDILRSVIKCALSRELSVEDPVTGEIYEGWWGLAPAWLKAPLDTDGRKWVTACMIQKLNYYSAPVPILMEGNHDAIAFNATYDAEFTFEESTTFGDMFSSTNPLADGVPAFEVYVCTEEDLGDYCGGLDYAQNWAALRICDTVPDNECGITQLGPCSTACANVGGYWQCTDSDGNLHAETVRVQLLEDFYGTCDAPD